VAPVAPVAPIEPAAVVPIYGSTRRDATPLTIEKNVELRPVQVIPSGLVAISSVDPVPAAIHNEPFHDMEFIDGNIDITKPVQIIPSTLVAMLVAAVDTAIHNVPFHATAVPGKPEYTIFQLMPSRLLAIPVLPTATHNNPFHATALPLMENVEFPRPVQVIPSGLVPIVLIVPSPTTTHNLPFHATPRPVTILFEVIPAKGRLVQLMPSGLVIIECVDELPTATHNIPFHATLNMFVNWLEITLELPIQVMPSGLVAII
jgi:hypothetical protein